MKKITYFLSFLLMFLGVSTANAEVGDVITNLNQLSDTKIYVISGPRATLVQDKTTLKGNGQANTSAVTTATSDAEKFMVLNSGDGFYVLYAYSKDNFVNNSASAGAYGEPQLFKITNNTHGNTKANFPWRLEFDNGNVVNYDNKGNVVVIDSWNAQDGGNAFQFVEVGKLTDQAKIAAMTFASKKANAKRIANTVAKSVGCPYGYSQEDYNKFKSVLDQYAEKTYSTIGNDATTATEALETAKSTLKNASVLPITDGMQVVMGNLLHTDRYVYAKETTSKGNRKDGVTNGGFLGSGTAKDNYRYLFTLKSAGEGKYKIYNNYYGKYVGGVPLNENYNGSGANPGNDKEFQLVDETNAFAFTVQASDVLGYCTFNDPTVTEGGNVNALHMINWDGVVRWTTSADASKFLLIPITEEVTNKWNAVIAKKSSNTENYVGYNRVNDAVATALATFNSATGNDAKSVANKALDEALATAGGVIMPEANKYYTIKCVRGTHNGNNLLEGYGMTEETDSKNSLVAKKLEAINVPAMWQFKQLTETNKTDRYYIVAANSGSYLSKTNGTSYRMRMLDAASTDKGEFVLTTASNIVNVDYAVALNEKVGNNMVSCRNENEQVVAWNGGNDGSSNNFLIKEVSSIPVKISDARMATLNLPFAVNVPAKVKAYTATDNGTEIQLAEVANNLIPAESPVILVADEAGTYDFTINYEDASEALTSALTGTLIPTEIAANSGNYILKNGDQGVAMYLVNNAADNVLAENKAYLAGSNGAASVLNFNGLTTSINNAVSSVKGENVYYDLNGRRVLYPVHGVYVKANGQKVYIK